MSGRLHVSYDGGRFKTRPTVGADLQVRPGPADLKVGSYTSLEAHHKLL
jgi:hypothetical protein